MALPRCSISPELCGRIAQGAATPRPLPLSPARPEGLLGTPSKSAPEGPALEGAAPWGAASLGTCPGGRLAAQLNGVVAREGALRAHTPCTCERREAGAEAGNSRWSTGAAARTDRQAVWLGWKRSSDIKYSAC
ncbi:Ferm, Arhgef And Pleckstrin Domain-Containing Protein 2 [Manis pentadactyla]|nr:Ferm, Arhgef And Pleckstrin Domain-Containing Protein 2 [Manis pentadactyla]